MRHVLLFLIISCMIANIAFAFTSTKLTDEERKKMSCLVCRTTVQDVEARLQPLKKKISKGPYGFNLDSAITEVLQIRCPYSPFKELIDKFDDSGLVIDECLRILELYEEEIEDALKRGSPTIADDVCSSLCEGIEKSELKSDL